MTKLELLYAQKSEKFGEVCAVAARELGYGDLSSLSGEDRIRVEGEAKLYVEQWEETVEMRTNFTIRPVTPLRHLLAEYHDICERILDEHEIVAGLLGYRQRAKKRRRPAVAKAYLILIPGRLPWLSLSATSARVVQNSWYGYGTPPT